MALRGRSVFAALLLVGCANFHVVEPGRFFRSGQMSAHQLRRIIEHHGIRTVVRLNGYKDSFPDSYAPVVEAGIDFVLLHMSAVRYPTRAELLALWETFRTAEYPVLVHCRAGADRTGLASTVYMLQRTGDFRRSMRQLALLPYWHLGWFEVDRLDDVFRMYEPFHGRMRFPDWVRIEYRYPGIEETELQSGSGGQSPRPVNRK